MIHNKRIRGCLLGLILWGAFMAREAWPENGAGRIVDVFERNVTVRMDSPASLKAGDKIDLSYVAETMEFLIGQYQLIQVKENVFIAKEITSSMPPSKEMKVRVTRSTMIEYVPSAPAPTPQRASAGSSLEVNPAAMDPREADPSRSSRLPVKVEVLGPQEGLNSAGMPTRTDAALSGPQGQYPDGPRSRSDAGVPGPEDFFRPDPSRWKEITYEDYKHQLVQENRSAVRRAENVVGWPALKPRLGVAVKTNESPIGQAFAGAPMGVRVFEVTAGSPAERNDLQVADIIYEVDAVKVSSADMFVKYMAGAGNTVRLKIQRNGQLLEKTVALPGK